MRTQIWSVRPNSVSVYIYVYIWICIYIHIYIYIYVHMYIYVCMCSYMYTCIKNKYIFIYICIHKCIHVSIYIFAYIHLHIYICTFICVDTTYVYIYIYTYTPPKFDLCDLIFFQLLCSRAHTLTILFHTHHHPPTHMRERYEIYTFILNSQIWSVRPSSLPVGVLERTHSHTRAHTYTHTPTHTHTHTHTHTCARPWIM